MIRVLTVLLLLNTWGCDEDPVKERGACIRWVSSESYEGGGYCENNVAKSFCEAILNSPVCSPVCDYEFYKEKDCVDVGYIYPRCGKGGDSYFADEEQAWFGCGSTD